jgi:4-amino-4-deoxy-L-arabinose transferase-like glycosyltransferase
MLNEMSRTQHSIHPENERVWEVGFLIILLAGAYLRLRGLTFQSYWDDELFSVAVSDPNNSLRKVIQLTMSDVHPPLFQVLLWCWFKVFGFSELIGRIFPAIFGILSIFTMFRIGCEISGRKTGFICALLCSINIFHIYYSQEVRSYSLLFLLGTLSLLSFIRLIKNPEIKNWGMYLSATAAMVYTHYFGLLALLAEVVAFLAIRQTASKELKKIMIRSCIVLAVMIAPLLPFIIRNAEIPAFWIEHPSPDFLIKYFKEYFGSPLTSIAAALFFLYGIIRISQTSSKKQIARLLMLWIAFVYIFPYIRSLMSVPMLTTRNTIIALPALFILIAIGLAEIEDKVTQAILLFSFTTISILFIFHDPPYYRTITKPQIREAAEALIAANKNPGVVYAPADAVRNFNIYFSLFHAPFRAQSTDKLFEKYNDEGSPPTKFWIIDGGMAPLFYEIKDDTRVGVLKKTEFKQAAFMEMEFVKSSLSRNDY